MADAGVASRRECERLIESGLVEVNGEVTDKLPVFIHPGKDRVSVNGRVIDKRAAKSDRVYLALYKPDNTLTTTRDGVEDETNARRTVLDLIDHPAKSRLIVVGRLGFHATGLVLLTNDGQLAQRLSHARFGVTKTYRIAVRGRLHPEALESLRKKFCPAVNSVPAYLTDEDGTPIDPLRIVREDSASTVIELVMRAGAGAGGGGGGDATSRTEHEGNAAIGGGAGSAGGGGGGVLARMLVRMGNPIKRLERTAIGPLQLRFLKPGESRRLTKEEVQSLLEATGIAPPSRHHVQARPALSAERSPRRPKPRKPRGSGDRTDRRSPPKPQPIRDDDDEF